jgi:hypothetical protein
LKGLLRGEDEVGRRLVHIPQNDLDTRHQVFVAVRLDGAEVDLGGGVVAFQIEIAGRGLRHIDDPLLLTVDRHQLDAESPAIGPVGAQIVVRLEVQRGQILACRETGQDSKNGVLSLVLVDRNRKRVARIGIVADRSDAELFLSHRYPQDFEKFEVLFRSRSGRRIALAASGEACAVLPALAVVSAQETRSDSRARGGDPLGKSFGLATAIRVLLQNCPTA